MIDEDKTKEELLAELASLRKEMTRLEVFEAQYRNQGRFPMLDHPAHNPFSQPNTPPSNKCGMISGIDIKP